MSNLFASRKGPMLLAGGLFGVLLYSTYGGTQQPRPRQYSSAGATNASISEALQGSAGTGGPGARNQEQMRELEQYDPKDTRLHSADPSAQSKRNPQKVRGDLGGDETTPGGGMQGKHIGDRSAESGGDLPWKKVGKEEKRT